MSQSTHLKVVLFVTVHFNEFHRDENSMFQNISTSIQRGKHLKLKGIFWRPKSAAYTSDVFATLTYQADVLNANRLKVSVSSKKL